MTTTHDHNSGFDHNDEPTTPPTAGRSSSAFGKMLDSVSNLARNWRRDMPPALDIRSSADPNGKGCIIGVSGVVDATNARELGRAMQALHGYRFVAIDLTEARFDHPLAQVKFDQLTEQLEYAGTKVVVSGARDDMRLSR